jgi:hypothetical protein
MDQQIPRHGVNPASSGLLRVTLSEFRVIRPDFGVSLPEFGVTQSAE